MNYRALTDAQLAEVVYSISEDMEVCGRHYRANDEDAKCLTEAARRLRLLAVEREVDAQ